MRDNAAETVGVGSSLFSWFQTFLFWTPFRDSTLNIVEDKVYAPQKYVEEIVAISHPCVFPESLLDQLTVKNGLIHLFLILPCRSMCVFLCPYHTTWSLQLSIVFLKSVDMRPLVCCFSWISMALWSVFWVPMRVFLFQWDWNCSGNRLVWVVCLFKQCW